MSGPFDVLGTMWGWFLAIPLVIGVARANQGWGPQAAALLFGFDLFCVWAVSGAVGEALAFGVALVVILAAPWQQA